MANMSNNKVSNTSLVDIFDGNLSVLTQDALDNNRIWVFGYGSILWKTGFEHGERRQGYITGYTRKFWQGNSTHRGTKEKPGRCATLIPASEENKTSKVWGVAYLLVGETMIRRAMDHLYSRECKLGGYDMQQAMFYTKDCICAPIHTLLFLATPSSADYLGPAPEFQLASQIVDCEGPSGHNIEYVILLSMYLKKYIPEEKDSHLSKLHEFICDILDKRGHALQQFVRTDRLPESELFENCHNCSSNNYQMHHHTQSAQLSRHLNRRESITLDNNNRQNHSVM